MVKPDLQCTRINEETVCSRHYLLIYSLSTLVTDSYCIVSDTGIGSSLGKRSALGPYISGCLESVRQESWVFPGIASASLQLSPGCT